MRNFVDLPTLTNVQKGGHVVLNCMRGMTYDQIVLELKNVTPSQMKNFTLKAGSRLIWDCESAKDIEDINMFYQRPESQGFLTLWFYRPELREEEAAITSFGTLDVPSMTIEFDLDDDVENPEITAKAVQRPNTPLGLVTKIRRYPKSFATSGLQEIDNIPRGARITAFHLQKKDVNEVELQVNFGAGPSQIIKSSKKALEQLQRQYKRDPVSANYTHIDLNLLGNSAGPMPTAALQDMRLKPNLGTSGNLTTLVEYIDGFNGV